MNSSTAGRLHEATNAAFWLSNPDWSAGNIVADGILRATRPLWAATYRGLVRTVYNPNVILAVNGESVVAEAGNNCVDKHMFRYPQKLSLNEFETVVKRDVGTVSTYLAGIALATQVHIKPARIFKNPSTSLPAVTQTQPRLDLQIHHRLDLEKLHCEPSGPIKDATARDLELLIQGSAKMIDECGKYPDITRSSGNLRRSLIDGSVTLIDVLPFYENGSRAIGDTPREAVQSSQNMLVEFGEFVGRYGA